MHPNMNPDLDDPALREALDTKTQAATELLRASCHEFSAIVFANSLGAEDMVVTDILCREQLPVTTFTLDTGRLPPETEALIDTVEQRYHLHIVRYRPDPEAVAGYVHTYGIDGFYDSIEARRACCRVRKIASLRQALAGQQAWITGLRAAQSVTRAELPSREHDTDHGLEKINPLADWSEREVWAYIRLHRTPYNALHEQGYPSIGCAPCTRAITVGEDIRAGRWWWESADTRECGLHPHSHGAVTPLPQKTPVSHES